MAVTLDMIIGMPRFEWEAVRWEPDPRRAGRRAAHPLDIDAYVPHELSSFAPRLDLETLTAVSDAEHRIQTAQAHADTVGVSTIAVQLLRSEAIASSQMEDVQTPSHRALAKALAKARAGEDAGTFAPASATIANVEAVRGAYRRAVDNVGPVTVADIQQTHTDLSAADVRLSQIAGQIRQDQNWIGRDASTPAQAEFVPPPAGDVPRLLDDLCVYASRRDVSPLVQAAVVHAQFETIHPFGDGNGRVGRALIGQVICRGGLARDVVPPTSLVLSRDRDAYVSALTAWRFEPDGADRWILLLAEAAHEAASASIELADQVVTLKNSWRTDTVVRKGSAADALIEILPAYPIIDIATAATLIGRSNEAARNAVNALERAGVLAQVTVGKRSRMWETKGLFALVDDLERSVSGGAISAADTK